MLQRRGWLHPSLEDQDLAGSDLASLGSRIRKLRGWLSESPKSRKLILATREKHRQAEYQPAEHLRYEAPSQWSLPAEARYAVGCEIVSAASEI